MKKTLSPLSHTLGIISIINIFGLLLYFTTNLLPTVYILYSFIYLVLHIAYQIIRREGLFEE